MVQIHDVKLGGTVTWYRYTELNWVVQLLGTVVMLNCVTVNSAWKGCLVSIDGIYLFSGGFCPFFSYQHLCS